MSESYILEPGDKASSVTAYTLTSVIRGKIITREVVRASNWLRTPGLADFAGIYDLKMTRALGTGAPEVLELNELHVPIAQFLALHLTPPDEDPVEYDPNEQNRKMEPVTAIAGPFRFQGTLRMPGHLTVAKQMGLMREPFIQLYDVTVISALSPDKPVKVRMVLLRPNACSFVPGKVD